MEQIKRLARWALCVPVLLGLCLLFSPRAHALTAGAGNIGIEQVYVNVPEMDVFVRAQDGEGNALTPSVARAAGVEMRLGDTLLDNGNIQTANEPICYIFAVDNYAELNDQTFRMFQRAMVRLTRSKAERDQVMLYGMDTGGELQCLLPATTDKATILAAVRGMQQTAETPLNLTGAAGAIYSDINAEYQSLAPRKVAVVLTDAPSMLGNLAALATLNTGLADQLNMAFYLLAATDEAMEQDLLGQMQGQHLLVCDHTEVDSTLREALDRLPQVLEFKTAIDPALYGERWETLTLSVPAMGSAITASTTVYMGHQLTHPAVEQVRVTGDRELTVTFNQAVTSATAGLPAAYGIKSEDAWGFAVGVRAVRMAADGYSAVLTTAGDLYDGPYSVCLRGVAAVLSSANTSDATAKALFTVSGRPRDRSFYLARLRVPGLVLLAALAVLAVQAFTRSRRERAAEKEAEIAHLLSGAEDMAAVPHRWLTLFIRPPGDITETRWAAMVESSLLIGSDAAQCDLCVADARIAAQHCMLSLDGDSVLLQPLGKARVYVNGQLLAGTRHLLGEDIVRVGRTQLRVIV